jgi:hypothetical protein
MNAKRTSIHDVRLALDALFNLLIASDSRSTGSQRNAKIASPLAVHGTWIIRLRSHSDLELHSWN